MYILIVDDDALIRKWLTMLLKQIPNREISVDAAENGVQALKSIQNGPVPDLLITDIKMPQMDGLELCQVLKRNFPQIPVVILSSYDEFPFVKKALQLGAIDYILKADMCLEDISSVIERAEKSGSVNTVPADDFSYAKEKRRLLEDYMKSGRKDDHTFLLRLDPRLQLETLTLMRFRLDRNVHRIVGALPGQRCPLEAVLVPYDETAYLAFIHDGGASGGSSMRKRASVSQFLKYLPFPVDAWSTVLNCGEVGVYAGIQTCQDVLDFKLYYSLDSFEQIAYRGRGEAVQIAQIPFYKSFFEVAGRYQIKEAEELMRKCLDTLHGMYCHPSDIKQYISGMCHKLLSDMSMFETGGDWFSSTLERLHEVESAPTRAARKSALERFFEQYGAALSSAAPKRSNAVLQALAYIDEHYAEKISLEQIAAQSHVNSTYMSELFKKEMGVRLIDYINNLRVIHACEYLRFSNYSMGQIAELCGFNDQNYFTKVFKKFLNTTPSNYRVDFKR